MVNTCLVIVFNHRYDKNIPVLEKMYADRFRHIRFLVPFYNGSNPNVIPVYESSNYFQSYFAQGFSRFFDPSFTHYIFIGDDCLLHPSINEHNVLEQTGLAPGADFLPQLNKFQSTSGLTWWHTFKGIDFFHNRKGAEIARELPARDEAIARFKKHGVDTIPLSMTNIFGTKTPPGKKALEYWLFKQYHFRYKWKKYRKGAYIELPYPIAGSYSDILIITSDTVTDFCRYCGIMAAAGLFVEIAIPTALLLSARQIMLEDQLHLQGKALWTPEEILGVEKQFNNSLKALLEGFPANQLYYHPVKLSKWKNDL